MNSSPIISLEMAGIVRVDKIGAAKKRSDRPDMPDIETVLAPSGRRNCYRPG